MNDYLKFLEGKARFAAWLTVFFVLLITIPSLLVSEFKLVAKIVGVIVIFILSVALWFWRTQTIRRIKRRARIHLNLNDRFWLKDHIPFYAMLSNADKKIFEDRIGLFLAEIKITEIGKEIPGKSTCFYVASSAVITFWGLPYWNYGSLSEVLVYPTDFNHDNQFDNKGSVQGKVHHGGLMDSTMILSLSSLQNGFKLLDSQNVGIHEFAHLLDKEDKEIDGSPFFLSSDERMKWAEIVDKEFNKNKRKSGLDGYAYTKESEFFAVLMETYRENPNRLIKKYPELFQILERSLGSERS